MLSDRTGGFNYGSGAVEVEVGSRTGIESVGGKRAHWLRCRLDVVTRRGASGASFTHPPEIYGIGAGAIGARIPAIHAQREVAEPLGDSDGTPGQHFQLRHAPLLQPHDDETLEVREPGAESWESWELQESFAESEPEDRHVVVDAASGEVELGPAVRAPDGGWRQYGRVPAKGAALRFSSYRHGGGRDGQRGGRHADDAQGGDPQRGLRDESRAGDGGLDREPLISARRARLDGAADSLARGHRGRLRVPGRRPRRASPGPICVPIGMRARPGCTFCLASGPARHLEPHELAAVTTSSPRSRVPGRTAAGRDDRSGCPGQLRGISVVVNVQAAPRSDLARVERDIEQALYRVPQPARRRAGARRSGRRLEFGRALNQGEVYGIVHAVEGVEFVKILRVYETDLVTGKQDAKPAGTHSSSSPTR